jgi:protein-S-isoprenylcysteine O-methyltransferase Ste14
VLSFAALYHVFAPLHWSANPDANVWVIDYPEWLWRALLLAHFVSIAVIYASFLQSDYLEFWGVKQMVMGFRAITGHPNSASGLALFGTQRLVTEGVYRWVRHPMLAGGLLFILTAGPSKNNLLFAVYYLIYMLAGAYFEERRLVRVFGDEYLKYRRSTGAFLPRLVPASRDGAGRG